MGVFMSVLVIAELVDGKPSSASVELIALARGLSAGTVIALLLGAERVVADALIARGADKVILGTRETFDGYNSDVWVTSAASVASEHLATLVLAPHTPRGADLLPRLAFRLEAACATGCVIVDSADGALRFTRATLGGNVRETLRMTTTVAVATVQIGRAHV